MAAALVGLLRAALESMGSPYALVLAAVESTLPEVTMYTPLNF